MESDIHITLREATASRDIARHWKEMDAMMWRDVRPNCDLGGPMTDEEAARFLTPEYHQRIDALCQRQTDPGQRVFFLADGREVGFAFYCTYRSEDGKCFIVNFCIDPELRGRGLGERCFAALAEHARQNGARYFELNTHCKRAARFWEKLGFRYNGYDEEGTLLLCRPPEEALPFAVERLAGPEGPALDWQLRRLQNGFRAEIGEEPLDDGAIARLTQAIREERVTFFLAKRGARAVGMCSVSPGFSTFCCGEVGTFDDFFVEPVFRKQGAARLLASAAQDWCARRGLGSLTVCCAPCDEEMYQALGFHMRLGASFTWLG